MPNNMSEEQRQRILAQRAQYQQKNQNPPAPTGDPVSTAQPIYQTSQTQPTQFGVSQARQGGPSNSFAPPDPNSRVGSPEQQKQQRKQQAMNASNMQRRVIDTTKDVKDGRVQCPACGSTDISPYKDGLLRCNFCRKEFKPSGFNDVVEEDLTKLVGESVTSGAADINQTDNEDVITVKCEGCGAEISVPAAEAQQARCHWCRSYLSFNVPRPSGAVPDAILPFSVSKQEAESLIQEFVNKRQFFAHPAFKKEFTTENIMPVYFPYYIVDVNAHGHFAGEGEHEIRRYTVSYGDDSKKTVYDVDVYKIEREFDIGINDLTLDASQEKLDVLNKDTTNNIVNSIMPFDTKNCVRYDANYLKGTTVEPRDTNIEDVRHAVSLQSKDIARHALHPHIGQYDRGVRWDREDFNIIGTQWATAFLPVWMYSYYERKKDGGSMLHYAAVNARTKETMGSVPINFTRLWTVSIIIEVIAAVLALFLAIVILFSGALDSDDEANVLVLALLLLAGPVFFFVTRSRYRNDDARHYHESETENTIRNVKTADEYHRRNKGVENPRIKDENGGKVEGDILKVDIGSEFDEGYQC